MFLQGFLQGLGVANIVTSPTFALEQRYKAKHCEVLHIDLYRLDPIKTDEFLYGSEDHTGIRCIEWIERSKIEPDILVSLEEKDAGRMLTVTFDDIPLPEESDIIQWRKELALPKRICDHCNAVSALAQTLSEQLLSRGVLLRPKALHLSALVHDLLRFIDFVPGAGHGPDEDQEPDEWASWKTKFKDTRHEAACAKLLEERGYPELASIVAVHGLTLPSPKRSTIEQKLLFYADKRVKNDEVVTLEERFADFRARYTDGENTKKGNAWFAEAKALEKELFPT
jgi:HD superfamily phosphohydrolase YqeK